MKFPIFSLPSRFSKLQEFFFGKARKNHPWVLGISAFFLFILFFFISSLSTLRVFLPHAHELTGFPLATKQYLIVFQNNNELRPAGGFISSYGLLTFQHGVYSGLSMHDVYGDVDDHPFIKPPYPMEQLLADPNYQGYTFRDANFAPDYPTTAHELIRMLKLTQPTLQIDGVIAINFSFLEDLVGVLGPMTVEKEEGNTRRTVTFTRDNLFEKLEHEVNNIDLHNLEQLQQRKNILKNLSQQLLGKLLWNPLKLRKVSDTIVRNLTLKNIQLFFTAPSLQRIADHYAWAGRWPAIIEGDFLGVNEANLGGMKSDRYLQRNITYQLRMEPGTPGRFRLIGEVSIDIAHLGIDNIPLSGTYKGFFRTYVPRGARLLEVAPGYRKDIWEREEELFHVFGNIVTLKPGEKTQLFYRYELPEFILKGSDYRLFIPKQSGTERDFYTFIFQAPQGYGIQSSSLTSLENTAIYRGPLETDLLFQLNLLPDTNPPRVVHQVLEKVEEDGTAKISLFFNEVISGERIKEPGNYQIEDLDTEHPEHHDEPGIEQVELNGKQISLRVKAITRQPGEFYSVTLKDVEDSAHNPATPLPLRITVKQTDN